MIAQYLQGYRRGAHCASTSLMNVCKYYKIDISEDMCFGLGQALGFSFYKDEIMNMYSFSGRSRDIIRDFFETTGIKINIGYNLDDNILWEIIRDLIKQKKPVMVKLDIDSLGYLVRYFRLAQKIEQSEHIAVVIGIDNERVYLSEYYQKQPIELSKQEFLSGLSKKFEPKSINNLFYVINEIPDYIDYQACAKIALISNQHNMKYGFGSNLGLPGLKKFAHDLEIIYKNSSREEFWEIMGMASICFEKIGTGGGNFRRIYARFLREVGRLSANDEFETLSRQYAKLAVLWKQFAALISWKPVDEDREDYVIAMLRELISQIYIRESEAIEFQKILLKGV